MSCGASRSRSNPAEGHSRPRGCVNR
jgi:hypothetical protein